MTMLHRTIAQHGYVEYDETVAPISNASLSVVFYYESTALACVVKKR